MKTLQINHDFKTIVLLIVLFFALIWMLTSCKDNTILDLENKITQQDKELKRIYVENLVLKISIDSLQRDFDTIEVKRTVYRTKFDTVFIKQLITKKDIDSAARANLIICMELDRLNEKAITKLKAINIDKGKLIESLEKEIVKCYGLNESQDNLLIALRSENAELSTKLNRRTAQRNLTWIGITTGVILYIVFK